MSHHPCEGCALQRSREGRVCPSARDLGLEDIYEAERQAEVLRRLVLAEAPRAPAGLAELVRREVAEKRMPRGPLLLPAGAAASPVPDSREEAIRVQVSRPDR